MTKLDELKARRAGLAAGLAITNQQLKDLSEAKAALDELIKREEEAAAKMNKAAMFVPVCENNWAVASTSLYGGYVALPNGGGQPSIHVPRFRTREHAEAIAFARSIEDQMRAQPGCVVAEHGVEQFLVLFTYKDCKPCAAAYADLDDKLERGQWGVFDTEENLLAAIRTVGAENLTRAAKAKVGIY